MAKIVYYVNQFYGGVGGEDVADYPLEFHKDALGPAKGFATAWGDDCEVVTTVLCGDQYFGENREDVLNKIVAAVEELQPDLFVAGPAFNAGRYGDACATACKAVQERTNVKVLTGMYIENPGAIMNRKDLYIVATSNSGGGMRKAIPAMVKLAKKIVSGEEIGTAADEGYIPRGYRKNLVVPVHAAERAADMLYAKLNNKPYTTEVKVDEYEKIDPAPPIKDLSKATIAFVTEAAIVPLGNPDHIKHASATNWAKYSLEGIYDLVEGQFEGVHGGFDASWCNADPDRVMPVDAVRHFESTGYIGKMFETFYSTCGNGTPIEMCKKFGAEIAQELLKAGVDGVLSPAS